MKIDEILKRRQTLSFEIFPPKPELDRDLSGIKKTISTLRSEEPDFISVTYGAGGGNRPRALDIAKIVLSMGMQPLSHLTAVGYTREDVETLLASLFRLEVRNILALRGDIPKSFGGGKSPWKDYRTALDLVESVACAGDFCIGGAAYPEGHQESVSPEMDVDFMREKVRAGVSFFITQLFFENDDFRKFIDRVESSGMDVPIIAGVMPVFKARQIRRIVELSGCAVPEKLERLLDRYAEDDASMADAGMDYAAEQIDDLWRDGVRGVHIYTMNRADGVLGILERCGLSKGRGLR